MEELSTFEKTKLSHLCSIHISIIGVNIVQVKSLETKAGLMAELVYYQNLRDKLERIINQK